MINNDKLKKLGHWLGCHQRPERSFFWNGHQFPVCARCTGVYIGEVISLLFWFACHTLCINLSFVFCSIMFLDWLLQHQRILESNNIRRFITGVMGGYGTMALEISLLQLGISFLT